MIPPMAYACGEERRQDGCSCIPFARAQTAFDIHLRALAQIFTRDLGEPVEEHHAVPLGALLGLTAGFVLPGLRGRHGDIRDRAAGWHVFGFRIVAQVANQNDFVDAPRHEDPPVENGRQLPAENRHYTEYAPATHRHDAIIEPVQLNQSGHGFVLY